MSIALPPTAVGILLHRARVISLQHRVKMTKAGEAHPTRVAITYFDADANAIKVVPHELDDEQDEYDFLHRKFPIRFVKADGDTDLNQFPPYHIKTRKLGAEESLDNFPANLRTKIGKADAVVTEVPSEYEGLRVNDIVLAIMGGSGAYLTYSMAVIAEKIGAKVFWVKPSHLKAFREEKKINGTEEDARLLTELFQKSPELFFAVSIKDQAMIKLREVFRRRQLIQKDRKACDSRVRAQTIGKIFVEGASAPYLQGGIEREFDQMTANDSILQAVEAEEARLNKAVAKALEGMPVYEKLFKPIVGVGPIIAAGIITAIGDIRLFVRSGGNLGHRAGGLKKFSGVACLPDGAFARKRAGETLGYHPELRQTLYLCADQFNRRPDSEWGTKFKAQKTSLRAKHPYPVLETKNGESVVRHELVPGKFKKTGEKYTIQVEGSDPVVVSGKLRFTDGHIHKMAVWYTLAEFVEWIYQEWTKLEGIVTETEEPTKKV